jgi:hypothetical protein
MKLNNLNKNRKKFSNRILRKIFKRSRILSKKKITKLNKISKMLKIKILQINNRKI